MLQETKITQSLSALQKDNSYKKVNLEVDYKKPKADVGGYTPPINMIGSSPMKVERKTPTPNILSSSKNSDYFKVKIEITENKKATKDLKNSYQRF